MVGGLTLQSSWKIQLIHSADLVAQREEMRTNRGRLKASVLSPLCLFLVSVSVLSLSVSRAGTEDNNILTSHSVDY